MNCRWSRLGTARNVSKKMKKTCVADACCTTMGTGLRLLQQYFRKGQPLFSFQMMFGRNMTECLLNPTQECIGHLFFWGYTIQLRHSQRTHTHSYEHTYQIVPLWEPSMTKPANSLPTNKHTQILPLWISRQILEIDKVTIGVSLFTGTLPTTESTMLLNFRKFARMGSWTQNLRCYWISCIHYAIDPIKWLVG